MNRKTPRVIDIELDEPSRMTPALNQVDRLLKQSLLQTQSLQVVRHMLLQDQFDKAQLNGHSKLLAAATLRQEHQAEEPLPKKRRKNKVGRKSPDERKAQLTAYLQQHAGQDTNEIAEGIGWRRGLVARFAKTIAVKKPNGHRQAPRWFLKATNAPAAKPARQAPGTRQEQIQGFLSKHPEAFTAQIAKAMRVKNNSSFVKMVRQVAQPVRPTKATQPIQWVLSA